MGGRNTKRMMNGYPIVPDNEHVLEATCYRYCRMMLIEAGYEDKVMNYTMAKA